MRLTKRDGGGNAVMDCDNCEIKFRDSCCSKRLCSNALIDKLAAYEDAEEQGLLVRLPCKVGDTVWWVPNLNDRTIILKDIVYGFHFSNDGLRLILPDLEIEPLANHNHLFFAREEAEAALKGEREDEYNGEIHKRQKQCHDCGCYVG